MARGIFGQQNEKTYEGKSVHHDGLVIHESKSSLRTEIIVNDKNTYLYLLLPTN